MISVKKDADLVPQGLQTHFQNKKQKVVCARIEDLLSAKGTTVTVADKTTNLVDKGIYQRVKGDLMGLYHGKCAYCERDHRQRSLQIDHFRPVNGGYYWLAYEWTNLVLACSDCNGEKSNQFPALGSKIKKPGRHKNYRWYTNRGRYLKEEPELLNPEHDDPADFLAYQHDGTIMGVDPSGRGKRTIQICRLNDSLLINSRLVALNQIRDRLLDVLFLIKKVKFETKADFIRLLDERLCPIFTEILLRREASRPFAGMFRFSVEHFEEIFAHSTDNLRPLADKPKKILSQAFSRYVRLQEQARS